MSNGDPTYGSRKLGCLSGAGIAAAAVALIVVLGSTVTTGASLFSPGPLSARSKGRTYGGVSDHAQLGLKCGACHTAPWSVQTMADRCMRCHTGVRDQLTNHTAPHDWLVGSGPPRCGGCHPDHRGAGFALTDFDHDALPFKLTGKHAGVPCDKCHSSARSAGDMRNTPTECYSCHSQDDHHGGKFGKQCGACHSPDGWKPARFDHKFPIDHGAQGGQANSCTVCHPKDVSTYDCFGCHQHTPGNVVGAHEGKTLDQLRDCARCHPQGQGGG